MCKSASHGTVFVVFSTTILDIKHWVWGKGPDNKGPINVKIRMKISTLPYLSKTLTASTKQWKTVMNNTLQKEQYTTIWREKYINIWLHSSRCKQKGRGKQQKKEVKKYTMIHMTQNWNLSVQSSPCVILSLHAVPCVLLLIAFIWRYSPLSSRLTVLMSHVLLNECILFIRAIFNIHWSSVLTALFGCCMGGATWNCCHLGTRSVYTIQLCIS